MNTFSPTKREEEIGLWFMVWIGKEREMGLGKREARLSGLEKAKRRDWVDEGKLSYGMVLNSKGIEKIWLGFHVWDFGLKSEARRRAYLNLIWSVRVERRVFSIF